MNYPSIRSPENINDENISNAIDAILKPVRQRMHINTFVKKFLPFLGSEPLDKIKVSQMLEQMSKRTGVVHTPKDLHINLMNEWMNEVGSPFVEVEVYTAENTLAYIIPPILDNNTEISEQAEPISNLVEQASNQARVYPRLGEEYINRHILPLINHSTMRPEFIEMWNKVYAYHGMPLIKTKKDDNVEVEPTVKSNVNEISEFDEFDD